MFFSKDNAQYKISFLFICILFSSLFLNCSNLDESKIDTLFEKYSVKGSVVIYDLKNDEYYRYHKKRCKQGFLPASTFKIPNTLIALEEKVIQDENSVIKWDGKKRDYKSWNSDHNLRTAYKYSVVWFYQKLALRVGMDKMNDYLKKMNYGNQNTSAGIDQFWLKGKFKISQEEQIQFLKKLYLNDLPFSQRNINILKDIMTHEDNEKYIIKAKTGLLLKPGVMGWWVGWLKVKKTDNVYFFATNLVKEQFNKDFSSARINLTKDILKELKFIKQK